MASSGRSIDLKVDVIGKSKPDSKKLAICKYFEEIGYRIKTEDETDVRIILIYVFLMYNN